VLFTITLLVRGGILRILMVTRGVVSAGRHAGGAELVATELAENLARSGTDVVFVSDVEPKRRQQMPANVSVVEIGTYRGLRRYVKLIPVTFLRWLAQHLLGNTLAAWRARRLLQSDDEGFDLVHVHGALAAILLRWTRHTKSTPLVYTEHDATPWSCRYRSPVERVVRRCIYRWVNLRACRVATVVTVGFPSLADELADRAGLPRSRFTLMGCGLTAEWLSRQRDANSVKVVHGLDRYLLFVGSLVPRKCPDVLLRALAKVSLPCIFVGEGPMRASLERLAVKFGIADRVVFVGAVDHRTLHCYYSGAEALVLPSVSETVGIVAMEALGVGVPVVASNLLGVAAYVHDQENGLLVKPGDEASLTQALSALETDESLRAKLRRQAENSSRAADGWQTVANQLQAIYEQHWRTAEGPPLPLSPAGTMPEGQPHA
jgi:glycosyltransferase involved in cell wall biosynthesis